MMARDTSIAAYNAVKSSGLVGQAMKNCYQTLYDHGPLTANEMWTYYLLPQYKYGQRTVTPMTAKLRNMGLIYEVRERKCRTTNITVIEWDVTTNLPPLVKPKKVKKQCANCEILQAENDALRNELDAVGTDRAMLEYKAIEV